MATMTATAARNNIRKLWNMAATEPVTIVRAGKPIAVVVSPEEYARLTGQVSPRQGGLAKSEQ